MEKRKGFGVHVLPRSHVDVRGVVSVVARLVHGVKVGAVVSLVLVKLFSYERAVPVVHIDARSPRHPSGVPTEWDAMISIINITHVSITRLAWEGGGIAACHRLQEDTGGTQETEHYISGPRVYIRTSKQQQQHTQK